MWRDYEAYVTSSSMEPGKARQDFELERLTLDFVTDCRQSVEFDSFTWAPIIRFIDDTAKPSNDERAEWNAKTDFSGQFGLNRPFRQHKFRHRCRK